VALPEDGRQRDSYLSRKAHSTEKVGINLGSEVKRKEFRRGAGLLLAGRV